MTLEALQRYDTQYTYINFSNPIFVTIVQVRREKNPSLRENYFRIGAKPYL